MDFYRIFLLQEAGLYSEAQIIRFVEVLKIGVSLNDGFISGAKSRSVETILQILRIWRIIGPFVSRTFDLIRAGALRNSVKHSSPLILVTQSQKSLSSY